MMSVGGYHKYSGGYRDKCVGRSLGKQLNLYGNPVCAQHAPVYS